MSTIPNLETRAHPTKGRALHAVARVPAGGLLTPSPVNPLILLPSLSRAESLCAQCFGAGTPRACTRCRAAYYCDAGCQAAHWRAAHGKECRPLAQSGRGGSIPTPVRAAMQIMLREDAREGVAALEGHVEGRMRQGRAEGTWGDMEMMAMGVSAFSGMGTTDSSVKTAVEALCKIQTNAFQRFDPELGQTGVFLEPTLAMINHSCIPNTTVQFLGRHALLRAERDIEAGDEIEISYTDYSVPLPKRKEELAPYRFECRCPRCKNDLNVYQVCAASPGVDLHDFSLAPTVDKVKQHPAVARASEFKQVFKRAADDFQAFGKKLKPWVSTAERRQYLRDHYRRCEELVKNDLWAVSPVPEILSEISQLYVEEEDYSNALLVSCITATACDPYRFPSPFHPVRVTELAKIARLLSNTAPGILDQANAVVTQRATANVEAKAQQALRDIDQTALSQMLCIMVVQLTQLEYIRELSAAQSAREILDDIRELPGRDKELSLISSWAQNPKNEASRAFFKFAVVDQVHNLAELGKSLLRQDFVQSTTQLQ